MSLLNKDKILEQAKAFADEGKLERAIVEYEKVLEADPQDLRVKARVAELYVKCKKPAEAIKLFQEVAHNYTQDGFYLKAITVYKNILRLNPSLMEVNQRLAELYEKMELKEDAVRQYDILASTCERRGESEKVREIRERMVRIDPKNYAARVKLAELYQMRAETDKALDQYEEMVALLGSRPEEERKRIDLYERVLHYRPDRLVMFRELVKLYFRLNEKKKALKWLEQKKDVTPFDPELLRMQAECYTELNQLEPARQSYFALSELFAEQSAIDQALLALGEVALILPEDEQEVVQRAEKLRQNSSTQLYVWIAQKRAELAAQSQHQEAQSSAQQVERQAQHEAEHRKQLELEQEQRKAKMREIQAKLGSSKVPEQTLPPLDPPPPRQVPQVKAPVEKTIVSPIAPQASTKLPSAAEIRAIESALSLVSAYQRMSLSDEAKKEFRNAQELLNAFAIEQLPVHLAQRLRELEQQLFSEATVIMQMPTEESAKPSEPEKTPPKDPKKRKVSFV